MRVAIHQPEYLGYIGFYNKMMNSDAWIFLDNVQLSKGDFVNRNRIRDRNGVMWLSVPVITKGRFHQKIQEVEIHNQRPWNKIHWKSILQEYRRAPYFAKYEEPLACIFEKEWTKLVDLNIALIKTIAQLIGLERPMVAASRLGVDGKSSQLLADLCQAVGAQAYLSGPMGRDYLEEDVFRKRGISVQYNDFTHPVYSQIHGGFIPYLAVIDLLFNCGPSSIDIIARGGECNA